MNANHVFIPHIPTRFEPLNGERVPTIDLNPAASYGTLRLLANLNCGGPVTQDLLPTALEQIRNGLSTMSHDDYIVAVGDPVLLAAAIAYAADMHGKVKVLRWDRHTKSYTQLEVTL